MNIIELINKSQHKIALSKKEIFWLVEKFTKDEIPDYQMSTWLATIFLNPLTEEETSWLTEALCHSGETLSWIEATVDKHSTGGVGDKTSLIIAPLVASLGYKIPMMAGRGLGHTGGTIDKLESIEFQTDVNLDNFKKLVNQFNVCIMGQSENFCPADKRLYALRDATHTVANIPLICSSIMSKKIAEGLNGLVLDVKYGSGAFMTSWDDSKSLAKKLIAIGEKQKIKTYAVLSAMNQPLGRYIGNKLEILECFEILKYPEQVFEKYKDNILLSLVLSALMLQSLHPKSSLESNFETVYDQLMSGKAYAKFVEMIKAQNGNIKDFINYYEKLTQATNAHQSLDSLIHAKKHAIKSDHDGYMNYTNVKALGLAAVDLGAGRLTKEDQIDFNVGFYCYKKLGDQVQKNDHLFDVYYNDEEQLNKALVKLHSSFKIEATDPYSEEVHFPKSSLSKDKIINAKLIQEILTFNGDEYTNIHLKTQFFEV